MMREAIFLSIALVAIGASLLMAMAGSDDGKTANWQGDPISEEPRYCYDVRYRNGMVVADATLSTSAELSASDIDYELNKLVGWNSQITDVTQRPCKF